MSMQGSASRIALDDFLRAVVSSTESAERPWWPGTGNVTVGLIFNSSLDPTGAQGLLQRSAANHFGQQVAAISGRMHSGIMTVILEHQKLSVADRKIKALEALKRLVASGLVTQAEADTIRRIYDLSADMTKSDADVAQDVEKIVRGVQYPSTTAQVIFNIAADSAAYAARVGRPARLTSGEPLLQRSFIDDDLDGGILGAIFGSIFGAPEVGAVVGAVAGSIGIWQ